MSRFGTLVLAGSLAIGSLSACDKPSEAIVEPSPAVTAATKTILLKINETLDESENGRETRAVLEMIRVPASCELLVVPIGVGFLNTSLKCVTGPLPDHPKGVLAHADIIIHMIELKSSQVVSILGVELKDGVLDENSGCAIVEDSETHIVLGSSSKSCKEVNRNAGEFIDEFRKRKIEDLGGNSTRV